MTLGNVKNFNEFIRNNERQQDKLKKLIDPLKQNFGIDVFWHVTVRQNGQFSSLCSFADAFCDFWDNHCYKEMGFFISPAHLNSGYYLLDYDSDYKKYLDNVEGKYPLHHPFLIIRKDSQNKADLFGFSSRQHIPALPNLYINNLPILNSYIDYFLETDRHFKAPAGEHMIDIAGLRGHDTYYQKSYGDKLKGNASFLKQIGASPYLLESGTKLTRREKEVLSACHDGKTAAQSGDELGISSRTVEYYRENAKDKLGILTRNEFMESIQILKMAGLLE